MKKLEQEHQMSTIDKGRGNWVPIVINYFEPFPTILTLPNGSFSLLTYQHGYFPSKYIFTVHVPHTIVGRRGTMEI